MSQKYPYTNREDDFPSRQDMYTDSYQRQSNTYRPSIRSSSQEQNRSTASSNRTVDSPVNLPGKALSFLHSCGLDSSDIAHLAEIPEHLFTVETLSSLLLQIKERKLSSASSSRPSTSQPLDDTSAHSWEGSSHTTPVEYPINRPVHPVYPLPPEQVQTWQDRWGNPRQRSSSKSSSGPDYSVSKDTNRYHNTIQSAEASSCSFVDSKPRPLLSLKLEPPVVRPTRKEASDFNCKIPPAFPHVCRLCDISVRSTRDWFSHVRGNQHVRSQLGLLKKYPKWAQTVDFEKRSESSEGKHPHLFWNLISSPVVMDWSAHVTSGQHAQSQLDLMAKYPEWDGTVQSSRRNDVHTSTDIRAGTSQENTSDMKMSPEKNEEDHDFPKILENCVTLDEFMEEKSSDFQESDEAKVLIPKTEIRNLPTAEDETEEHHQSRKATEEKPSEEKALSSPQKEKEEVEVKAENVDEVNKEHTEEHNTDMTETQNVELKTQKVESDIDVPPIESSSVTSSAGVSEKSQEPTEAPTPPTESVKKPETTTDTLGPYEPNIPMGVEFVKMGYYCRVCFCFYSNEDTAKKVHCSSQAHYEKLKKHLKKEKAKAQSNREKS
ncbi:hypothetical protein QTP70_021148 [Hemibagrus guttatus]|uniref:Matrin-type domain-containing protein n=1 Tax=Hemibagrus guttatus TaxID=175788 RepID=A0AAE0QXW9_9TELE|nr:hypothetical protein QTP70_021148 [Hemibagrus guttatus]KAK3565099.1 hypothetical protein QTP86_033154 [Hemibagrus guttatus]